MRLLLFCLSLLGIYNIAYSQDVNHETLSRLESDLLFYADVMVNTFKPSTRKRAASEFDILFEEYLASGQAFAKKAEFFKFISILDAPDNKFKLITWIKNISDAEKDYSGYIFFEDGRYIKLNRTTTLTDDLAYNSCTQEDWYGCHYYRIMKSDKSYLLFGIDFNGKYDNRKIVDILSFENDFVVFGKEIFEDKEEPDTYLNRLILSFSSDATVYLNYDPKLEMIVHDHLEPRLGLQPGQGPTNIPDGTYEGYNYEKGKWRYNKKLFNHVYETAPRPKPVFKKQIDLDSKN